jgi:hypothetical protein
METATVKLGNPPDRRMARHTVLERALIADLATSPIDAQMFGRILANLRRAALR